MEIKVEDYLSESEMKNLAVEAFRNKIAVLLCDNQQVERVIYNTCYYVLRDLVDAHFDGDVETHIKNSVIKNMDKLSVSDVFGYDYEDFYRGKKPLGRIVLEQTVTDNKDIIRERVAEVIKDLDQDNFRYILEENVFGCLMERMFGKEEVNKQ